MTRTALFCGVALLTALFASPVVTPPAMAQGGGMLLGAPPAAAEDSSPHSDASLVSEVAQLAPGQPFTVALRLTMEPKWHSYWLNPGDSGLPTVINWRLPDGFEAGPIQWPYPEQVPVEPFMTYAYYDEVLHLIEVTPPADLAPGTSITLAGTADWLICEQVCLTATQDVALSLSVAGAATPDPVWASRIAETRTKLPHDLDGLTATASRSGDTFALVLGGLEMEAGALANAYFFASEEQVIQHNAPQAIARADDGTVQLALARSEYAQTDPALIAGVLVASEGTTFDGTHRALWIEAPLGASASAGTTGAMGLTGTTMPRNLLFALGFALLGGLLLNLMPCVFPILSIKVLGFAQHGGSADGTQTMRRNGWLFGAGVLVSFWVLAGVLLALRAGGEALGWGFQLQSPLFVAAMALLFFALALNLLGVFEFGLGVQSKAGRLDQGEGASGAFFSGVLATLVATPCTAPFTMGPALGWALGQPATSTLAVFSALGLGMALPYVALSHAPRLLGRLPRPGPWMETFKQALAFPLFATVVWLVWVFSLQVGPNGVALFLGAATALGLAAWLYGRWQHAYGTVRLVTRGLALAALVAVVALTLRGAEASGASSSGVVRGAADDVDWGTFSPQRVAAINDEGRAAFVDFTATWCITCQVNKQVALRTQTVADAFDAHGVTPLTADWTNRDPVIAAELARFGRSSVPLYVLYPPDGEPVLLPEVLTPGVVLDALDEVVPTRDGLAAR
ncbi:MAG: protein-disulfide reductase DsbD domain-containing protein [Bacteroidota bacterium]